MEELIVITQSYPYSVGEDWMDKELKVAGRKYNSIYLMPLDKLEGKSRPLPVNVKLIDDLNEILGPSNTILLKNFWISLRILFTELLKSKKSFYILKNIRWFLANVKKSLLISEKIEHAIKKLNIKNAAIYSVWLNEGSTALAILKNRKKVSGFVIRLHGYDLFDERREGNYMPFRSYCFSAASAVYSLSKSGLKYINNKGFRGNKFKFNYSGLYDNGVNLIENSKKFTIVSCSSMYPFKRVDLIANVIISLDFPVRWIHFGSGENMTKVEQIVKDSKQEIILKGRVENNEIIQFYRKESINLFLHLSTTEGLGMAAVEAMSFGIPLMACDTGGVNEVVNEKTGCLLPITVDKENIVDEIGKFKKSENNRLEFRNSIRSFFLKNFEADSNYNSFFESVNQDMELEK